jgi:hypothetical protein
VLDERVIVDTYDYNMSWCLDTHTHSTYRENDTLLNVEIPDIFDISFSKGMHGAEPKNGTTGAATNRDDMCPPSKKPKTTAAASRRTAMLEEGLVRLHLSDSHIAIVAKTLWAQNSMRKDIWSSQEAVACCIYKACLASKQERVPRAAKEICSMLGVDPKKFVKVWKVWGVEGASTSSSAAPSAALPPLPPTKSAIAHASTDINNTQARDCIIRQLQQLSEVPDSLVYPMAQRVSELDEIRIKNRVMVASPPLIVNAVLICVAMGEQGVCSDVVMKKKMIQLGWASITTLKKYTKIMCDIVARK